MSLNPKCCDEKGGEWRANNGTRSSRKLNSNGTEQMVLFDTNNTGSQRPLRCLRDFDWLICMSSDLVTQVSKHID